MNRKWIALLLALILALPVTGCAADKPQGESVGTTAAVETRTAAEGITVTEEELTQTAQWLMEQIPQPTYGSVGGEWAVFGLARSGVAVPKEYFESYGENVAAYTAESAAVRPPYMAPKREFPPRRLAPWYWQAASPAA